MLGYLGPELKHELGDLVGISIRVTNYGIDCDLLIRHGAMRGTIKLLKRLRRKFKD